MVVALSQRNSQHPTNEKLDVQNCRTEEATLFAPAPPDVSCAHQVARYPIPEDMIDFDAAKVVHRLSRFGYDAVLVGGCVRDILFGVRPKDFDVATSALPREVKRLFRNCRLIGRRFRLAHLLFKKGKIIEVATFRRSPTSEDDISDRHAAENLFGGPADDAIRRDFTINALMYDVNRREIHDYVGGLQDIQARRLNTIGDPDRRFIEDPVRIIRAVKFRQRLDLELAPKVEEAMRAHAHLVAECAPARLVEEVYKVLATGKSARCFEQLYDCGVLGHLMPGLTNAIAATEDPTGIWRCLAQKDAKVSPAAHPSEVVMLATLLYPFCRSILQDKGDLPSKLHPLINDLLHPMAFPKKCVAAVRQIVAAQRTFSGPPKTQRIRRILARDYAADALDLMEIVAEDDETRALHAQWLAAYGRRPKPKLRKSEGNGKPPRRRRRRRGPRKERSSSEPPAAPSATE